MDHAAENPVSVDHAPPCFRVVLYSGTAQWVFSWDPGDEAQLLDRLEQLAADEAMSFDWADAAIVSRQIARELGIDHAALASRKSS